MDVARFETELPALFDDFPRSPHPRGRRFDDVIEGVPNLARENNLALVNLAASLLEPGESYVEVGTYGGASLIAAMRGNSGDFVAIENFAMQGRDGYENTPETLAENLHRFDAKGATIVEGDAFELLESGALGDRRVGVYYYDGPHKTDLSLRGLRLVEPYLAPRALIVLDDWDWESVQAAVSQYVAEEPNVRLLVEIHGADHGQPQWWEGMAVLARRA
jgi:precorrin-6B methylase 2